jgi:hypothetical protein
MDGFMCRLCVNLTYRQTKAVLVIYPYFTASQYNVHFNTYILAPVFIYFLLDSGGGKGSYKALAASPQPEDSES